MTKELLPGLGSGALREALRVAHLYILRNDRWSEPVLCRACLKSAILAKDIPHAEGCLYVRIEALLSLSSPIEPPAEIANLAAFHEKETDVWAEQLVKARERIAELEAGAQASSEIREALAELMELKRRMDSESGPKLWSYGTIYAYVVNRIEELLAPSRQGAGGK